MTRHEDAMHLGMTYDCDQCDKEFNTTENLQRHKKSAHLGLTYECEECGVTLNSKQSLAMHIKGVHRKIKDKKCDMCDKSFSLHATLIQHKANVHTKDEDREVFECDKCDKTFYHVGHLKRHEEIVHMGIRYNCDICNKAFTSTTNEHMRRHMST